MEKIFGTDGIRGVANQGVLGIDFLAKLVPAIVDKHHPKHIVIGKDTRVSGDMLVNCLSGIFNAYGVDVTIVGLVPTPAISYITKNCDFDLGIMVSASHNPYQDNGIKIFNRNGLKLSTVEEDGITDIIGRARSKQVTHKEIGTTEYKPELLETYEEFVCNLFDGLDLSDFNIVVDCANGSFSALSERIFKKFDANVDMIFASPNGVNINDNCGVVYPGNLSMEVKKRQSSLGIAFDGDGDRVLICDENGKTIDGDHLIGFLAAHSDKVKSVAITEISNFALDKFLKSIGVKSIRTKVGDKYVSQEIVAGKADLGGEKSGHIVLNSELKTGDGLIAALTILKYLKGQDGEVSAELRPFELAPSLSKNLSVKDKALFSDDFLSKLSCEYSSDNVRTLVRKSGTENVIRILVEGVNMADLEQVMTKTEEEIRSYAG